MNFLLKLILNRFILSILIIFLFALDFKFLTISPLRYYSLNQPEVAATEYYEVELGAAKIYVYISYDGSNIHLVPTDNLPVGTTIENPTMVAWYYYGLALALTNIIPWKWFTKSDKSKDKKKKK